MRLLQVRGDGRWVQLHPHKNVCLLRIFVDALRISVVGSRNAVGLSRIGGEMPPECIGNSAVSY